MFSKTFIATLLASTAAASPLVSARAEGNAFGLISIRSGSDLQARAINAAEGGLWIGKNTTTYCPLTSGCPAGNTTTFTAANGLLSLNTAVPGGQQVYIASNTSAISFTPPHSADTHGGKAQGWNYTAGQGESFGKLSFPEYGFIACASTEGKGIYQVYATLGGSATGNCTGIDIATVPFSGEGATAWEYI
ncbi:hypothetical protein DSL72_002167 [Monilinia vaccinii-corymbosi]|uniref:Cell wall protein PhiA n=1 Tax=Monilinia vaccinii-corymbosi TaxID=61207 RepID=A0A8A3PBZ3_9HELO|nr:hypothetical protein DSL72_002167 [Monilinia vaccinii-corymbosi]